MTSDKNKLSPLWKIFKTLYEFLRPVLGIVILISAFMSCMKSAPGSHARLYSILILTGSVVLVLMMNLVNRIMQKQDVYRYYRSAAARKLEPGELIPLCFVALLILIPFYIVIITSFKTTAEANDIVFTWWPKQGFTLNAYKEVFAVGDIIGLNMGRVIINSFVYTLIPLTVGLTSACLSAYAYAKLYFRSKKWMYQVMIATMMMPGCVTMGTGYLMFDLYGWTNSPLPLIIPGLFSGAGTVMFMREFFMGIPNALLESARVDGAGKWKCFRHVIIPAARPAITAQFVLGFIGGFNDFMGPLIYLNDPEGYTLQVALGFMNNSVNDDAIITASCVIAMLPMMILYLIFQKQIVSGISMISGLKG